MISAPFYPGVDKQKPEWLSAVVLRPYHRAGESISTSSSRGVFPAHADISAPRGAELPTWPATWAPFRII